MPIVRESPAAKTLWASSEFTLLRREADDGPPTLVLAPSSDRPAAASLERLEHAYALRDELDPDWAARPLSYSARLWELTIEDPGGIILGSLVGDPWELRPFLRVAIGLASSLRRLHDRGLVHRDLSPSNLFVDINTGRVWLSGFGLASRVPRQRQTPEPPESIAGTLAYMAPEQTGRMNRSIDHRSDLYACGVVLYELLTGGLPFTASEPMEWIHCHVARRPVPPSDRVNGVPAPLSAMIMKLLAKNAEDRYQTAAGLEADLQACLDACDATGAIAAFTLGVNDVADRLMIPERLYGREEQVAALMAAFNRVVQDAQSETVFVSGYSGIGKSSIVQELQKNVIHAGGTFASAKADPVRRSVPYLTLAQALSGPVRSLLTRPQEHLDTWKHAFQQALGSHGQLIVNVLPDLALVVGDQPPVPDLPPHEASNRFRAAFRRFIQVFAQPGRPFVLFVDDLQWLDESTIELLESLVTSADTQHFLLVGAYRDHELDVTHPLARGINRLRHSDARYGEVVLSPLVLDDLIAFIADTLRAGPARVLTLARLVHAKTGGNPFFAIQFLTMLEQEGLLRFDRTAMAWTWDQAGIEAQRYTDNVVHLMIGRLRRLPAPTQDALTNLACLGGTASAARLGMVLELSEEEVHARLWNAIHDGLIVRSDRGYAFLHDRIQEAAFALIAEDAQTELHLRIGRLLLLAIPAAEGDTSIFEVVNHFNRAGGLISADGERLRVAELNLTAGRRAKATVANASALTYFAAGEELLPADAWERAYVLTFELAFHRAHCELLTADLQSADARLSMLSQRAASPIDSARVTGLRVVLHVTAGRRDTAIDIGVEYLRTIDPEWSTRPTDDTVDKEYRRLHLQVGGRSNEALLNLPLMADATARATTDVLAQLLAPAIATNVNLRDLILLRLANLSIQQGHTDATCAALVMLNMVVGSRYGQYGLGDQLGQLSVDLVEQRNVSGFKARVHCCFGCMVIPWTRRLRSARASLVRSFDDALEAGDFTYCAYSSLNLTTHLLACGEPLEDVQREAERGFAFSKQVGFITGMRFVTGHLVLAQTLRGLTEVMLGGQAFRAEAFEREIASFSVPGPWYWIRTLQAHLFLSDYRSALDAAAKAAPLVWVVAGFLEEADYHFHAALALAQHDAPSEEQPSTTVRKLMDHHQKLTAWQSSCPENFDDRASLVAAEIARVESRPLDALRLYEVAIRAARVNGFIQNEGLASELAAKFCAAQGLEVVAASYLRNARYCYQRWGADAKVRQLERLHPFLQQPEAPSKSSAIAAPVEHLDLETVVRVSQAVSTEIVLETLIDKLMVIALEHAGAERGLLVLPVEGEGMLIAAEATSTAEGIAVQRVKRLPTTAALPETIFNYVIRARDAVVVDDAAAATLYVDDAYITRSGVRSILCLPLVKQTKLAGVLYLENTVAANVFTPERIAILKLVASQAAVSIENARLYTDLRHTQAYLAHAQELSQTGSFGWNVSTGEVIWSRETFRIYDFDSSIPPTVEAIVERTHPEDRASVLQMVDRLPLEDRSFNLEYRLLMPDGSIKFLRAIGRRSALESSIDVTFAGAVTDVTAAKVSQHSLESAIREIEQLKDQLQEENVALREEIDKTSMFEEIVGTSPALRAVLSHVSKVASTDSTVLITGETGTGKELVARAIHKRSARASRPFVGVNCAAVPASLIASELFGHERGAFTGATEKRVGRFELADGGTLFLDEVGDLPADTQVALLRVLQEREFERVGGTRLIRVNVRVIAATNRDLESAIAAKTFRADLFYRLNVFPLQVPSLRERQEDIPLLVEYFVDRFGKRAGKPIRGIGRKALALLKAYAWPGNIRELQNVIERAVIISDTGTLTVDARWLSSSRLRSPSQTQTLVAQEREAIEAALAECKGRVSGPFGAALKLGVPASTLETKVKALQIDKRRFKVGANPTSR